MCESSHWYCILCTKTFFPYSVLNDNEFNQTVIGKQVKFTHIVKPAIYNNESFIKAVNLSNDFQIINIAGTRLKKNSGNNNKYSVGKL